VTARLRYPLALLLPVQALLGFWNLGLLSPWMDESGTLLMEHRPLGELLNFAARDVHPPLFYLLLYVWQRLPLGLDWAVQARALSVLFGLLATVALDRLWAVQLSPRARSWFLAMWTLSPCLLLYSRMSRSYSLQVLLVALAGAYLLRTVEAPNWRDGALLAGSLLAALYSHYAAGLAVTAAVHILMAVRGRWRSLAAIDAALVIGYAPWIWRLAASLGSWGSHATHYALTGTPLLEIPLKLVYWAISFTMGEAVPDAILVAGALALPLLVWMVGSGARQAPRTAAFAGLITAIGFVGVARWVSYPFVPARMLFVLPFLLLLLAAGAAAHRRAGPVAIAAMLVFALVGSWSYFHREGFRNKQYPLPMREIAQTIRRNSTAEDSVILVDSANSDPTALEYALGPSRGFLETTLPDTESRLASRLADPRVRTVWFLRATHDISGRNATYDALLSAAMRPVIHWYEPATPLEARFLRAAGMRSPPAYFHELEEYRR
jgi:hypothetical protein